MRRRFGVMVAAALLVVAAAVPAYARPALPDATDQGFLNEMLAAINAYRARHGVQAVRLAPLLNEYAKQRAARVSTFEALGEGHSGPEHDKGETLYRGGADTSVPASAKAAARAWYDEISRYDFEHGGYHNTTGNFTRLVRKGSTRIGAARSAGRGSKWYETYIVVNRQAPGNLIGDFERNVFPPR